MEQQMAFGLNKKEWVFAGVVAVVLVGWKHGSSNNGHTAASSNRKVSDHDRLINQDVELSPQEKKFAVNGVGFAPTKAPCSLSRFGHEEDDECKDWSGTTYSFSSDHKRLWDIKRDEKLPDSLSVNDLISQIGNYVSCKHV